MRAGKGRWALALLALYLLLSNSVTDLLPKAKDITQVKLVRALAIDKGEGGLRLTATGTLSHGSEGGETKPPLILKAEAETILAGVAQLQRESEGMAEFGHLTQCLIGEEQARESLQGPLDYIQRDASMRLDTNLFLLLGATGEEAVEGLSSKTSDLPQRLEAIQADETYGGYRWNYHLRQIVSGLEDNGSALVPALTLSENPDYDKNQPGEAPEKSLELAGLAFLKDYKLAGLLTPEESRGAALLIDQDQLDVIECRLENGALAGVRLVYAKVKLTPRFQAGALTGITARLTVKADLNELRGWADPFSPGTLEEMEEGCARQLEDLCLAALERSQAEGADFLHLRRRLMTQCPLEAAALRDRWEEWFPALDLQAEVRCQIERSYDIDLPMEEEKD